MTVDNFFHGSNLLRKFAMSKFSTFATTLLIPLLALVPPAAGAGKPHRPPKPLCRLEVQNAHLSTTLLEKEHREVVKVNVLSICNVQQTKVLITLEIRKKGEFGDFTYGPFTNGENPGANSGLVVKLQDKYVDCESSKLTKWFGVAYSRAFINGRLQFAGRTQSPKVEALPCGT
jgi:hypothetical protein